MGEQGYGQNKKGLSGRTGKRWSSPRLKIDCLYSRNMRALIDLKIHFNGTQSSHKTIKALSQPSPVSPSLNAIPSGGQRSDCDPVLM